MLKAHAAMNEPSKGKMTRWSLREHIKLIAPSGIDPALYDVYWNRCTTGTGTVTGTPLEWKRVYVQCPAETILWHVPYIQSVLNCVMAATHVPIAQATSSGRGSSPPVNDEEVSILLHQQQTMHVAHNIPNTIYTFSEGTQKGSLCTYSALCSITCCMNPQLGNITCICTGLGLTHAQEHTAQRKVSVWTPKGRNQSDGDRVHCHIIHRCMHEVV